MCGIVGLHLRDPDLYPRLGELLTGMLCEMSERGADSAGVAVYGDPVWSPPGHATVTVLDAEVPAGAIPGATVIRLGATTVVNAPVEVDELVAAVKKAVPGALIAGFGQDVTVLKGVGHPRTLAREFDLESARG